MMDACGARHALGCASHPRGGTSPRGRLRGGHVREASGILRSPIRRSPPRTSLPPKTDDDLPLVVLVPIMAREGSRSRESMDAETLAFHGKRASSSHGGTCDPVCYLPPAWSCRFGPEE